MRERERERAALHPVCERERQGERLRRREIEKKRYERE
jgi:hypothetical protein